MTQSFTLHTGPDLGRASCRSHSHHSVPKLIAVTGGPGAGKTAVLHMAVNSFCSHVAFLPEAATLLFSGGFWRRTSEGAIASAQKAIFTTQRELERIFIQDSLGDFGLCDRGTVDGLAYWPENLGDYWQAMGTTREQELNRYAAVIHLRTPRMASAYNHDNPSRTEDRELAEKIDEKIFHAWDGHPNRVLIEDAEDFQRKTEQALSAIKRIMEGIKE